MTLHTHPSLQVGAPTVLLGRIDVVTIQAKSPADAFPGEAEPIFRETCAATEVPAGTAFPHQLPGGEASAR